MRQSIFLSVLCCMWLCSCDAPISRDRLAEIMIEMYMFEQHIQTRPHLSPISDTTLVYASILQKYGYSVNDYQRSLAHHLKRPDKFKKTLIPHRDQMLERKYELQKAFDDAMRTPEEIKEEYRLFFPVPPPLPPFILHLDSIAPQHTDHLQWWIFRDTLAPPKEFVSIRI